MKFQSIILLCFLIKFAIADNVTQVSSIRNALKDEFPHQVSLHWTNNATTTQYYFCAGTLLSDTWVITLAICIDTLPDYGYIMVKFGNLFVAGYSDRVMHRFANIGYKNGPITLLHLEKPQWLDNKIVVPVNLPEYDVRPNSSATTIGWADTPDHQGPLKAVVVNVMYGSVCSRLYNLTLDPMWHFCTIQDVPKPSCISDAGAPLLIRDNGKIRIIGIAAVIKKPCDENKGLTIYENIGKYMSWIKKVIGTK